MDAAVGDFKRVRFSALVRDDMADAVEMGVDPAVFPAVARRLLLRAVVLVLVGVGLVAFAMARVVAASAAQEDLLTDGARTQGRVVWADHAKFEVTYLTDDRPWSALVEITSDLTYRVGDQVVVHHDPDDPARLRTTSEPNIPWDREQPLVVALVLAIFPLGKGVPWAVRWARRLVGRPRWRHGWGVLGTAGGDHPYGVVTLDVEYDEGDTERLFLTRPVRGARPASRDRFTGATEVWTTERGPRTALLGLGPVAVAVRPFDGRRRTLAAGWIGWGVALGAFGVALVGGAFGWGPTLPFTGWTVFGVLGGIGMIAGAVVAGVALVIE
ncbi:hypothetical protein AB0A74_12430 [Saccharothrix sp. NPDC042600]|uniref:hypothetical protein n=1 Tax=Saccharothrix TaxID=2071 RepID=UPI0033E86586|nr:hypothetical protein GCM10017745_07010 [Saccharothrix mutabilis subsp. capreolus]